MTKLSEYLNVHEKRDYRDPLNELVWALSDCKYEKADNWMEIKGYTSPDKKIVCSLYRAIIQGFFIIDGIRFSTKELENKNTLESIKFQIYLHS